MFLQLAVPSAQYLYLLHVTSTKTNGTVGQIQPGASRHMAWHGNDATAE